VHCIEEKTETVEGLNSTRLIIELLQVKLTSNKNDVVTNKYRVAQKNGKI
jgi:hypothetical protein